MDDRVVFRAVDSLDAPVRQVLATGEALVSGRHNRASPRSILVADSATELMAAPLPPDAGLAGALLVRGRLGQVRGFKQGDLLLFETLTSHAAVALGRARLVDRLRHDIGHDRLTGLLNRQGFADALAEAEGARAVLAVHLTSVREVTEALGHAAGESLIQTAAQRVTAAVPRDSLIGRVDNDILAVLLLDASEAQARRTADRILTRFEAPVELRGAPIACSAVIGLALSEDRCDLLRRAEIALRATTTRRPVGRYEVGMEPPSARRLAVAAELRRVLADPAQARQVVTYYQPKSALSNGRISGVEALVRWQHPTRGLIPPVDFVPVVESTDLVRPLTLHILNQALADLARWSSLDLALTVAVNLSARSLHDRDLIDDVSGLLRRHSVDPRLLTLEITESAVMEDPGEAQNVLEGLSRLGVSLSVDDFGTGYSSLSYLVQLPVDEVKVDRSFVSRITTDERAAAIVRSVVDLGHSLNLRVVAEGVEDQRCWDALTELGCDVAQGYLLSKPLPRDQFEAWLSAHLQSSSVH
jgi:EAL domain-containing protein (putative c-di-GMP-specific phosphodiesterase class I)/GGDEF domain-containing protein